jgi:hypothetical protein
MTDSRNGECSFPRRVIVFVLLRLRSNRHVHAQVNDDSTELDNIKNGSPDLFCSEEYESAIYSVLAFLQTGQQYSRH